MMNRENIKQLVCGKDKVTIRELSEKTLERESS